MSDRQVILALRALQGLKASRVTQVIRDLRESRELRDLSERQALWVQQEPQILLESLETPDQLA